jgi:ribonuclease P protein subunit POP4
MVKKLIFPNELIGEQIEVVKSTNRAHLNLRGKIIDETKNTIKIETQSGVKRLLKNNVTFKLKSGKVLLGKDLVKRSEDRIKGK